MIGAALLGLILVVLLPARALRPSRGDRPRRSRSVRFAETISEIAVLLIALAALAYTNGVTQAQLGLAWPPPRAGQVGLALGLFIIVGLAVAVLVAKPRRNSPREQEALAELPQGRREAALYLALAPAVGFGWEVLYRGFLLWWLTPLIGLVGAIVVASMAYGLAHGWKSRWQGLGSIASAFLFTIAYALTGSLWWLIMVHSALPLIAMLAGRRARVASPRELRA